MFCGKISSTGRHLTHTSFRTALKSQNIKRDGRAWLLPGGKDRMDTVDQRQAIDIERLINMVHELQDK